MALTTPAPLARTTPPTLTDRVRLVRNEGLHFSRRDERVLVVEPQTASWMVLKDDPWRVMASLAQPGSMGELWARFSHVPKHSLADFVMRLFTQNMLRLDGKSPYDWQAVWDRPHEVPGFIGIHALDGCNLRCGYCYADAGAALRKMDRELMVNLVLKCIREIPAPYMVIDFLGGEPLLAFDEIVDAVSQGRDLAIEMQKSVEFCMQTNGTLLTDERIEVLKSFNMGVGVSIDGPQHLHDKYRLAADGSGSWEEVYRRLLRARDLGLRVSPLAVIHDPASYEEVLLFFLENGFQHMRFNYSSLLGRARDNLTFLSDRGEAYAAGFLKMVRTAHQYAKSRGVVLRISDLNSMLRNLCGKNRDYMCMRSGCGVGDAILSFGTKGEIYACEEVERKTIPKFMVGRASERPIMDVVRESANYAALKRRRVENIPKCSKCHLRYVCGGGCAHKTLAYYGDVMREDPMCRYYEVVYEELMWMLHEDPTLAQTLAIV